MASATSPKAISKIRGLLFTIRETDRAFCGMFATTSFFSRDAFKLAADYAVDSNLKDFGGPKDCFRNYGKGSETTKSEIWLPREPSGDVSKGGTSFQ